MSEKITLIELDVSVEALLKNGAKAQAELEKLKAEANLLKKSIKDGGETTKVYADKLLVLESQGKRNTQQYRNLKKDSDDFTKSQEQNRQKLELVNNALTSQKKVHQANQRAITDFNKIAKEELGIITETDGSINQLNRALENNKKVYRNLTEEQRENEAIGGKLLETISEQDKKYKDLQTSIGTTQVHVGDYKEQIKLALQESSNFSQQMDGQISQIPIVGGVLSKLIKITRAYAAAKYASAMATNTGSKALKLFRISLIATGIGAFIVILGSLIAYFSSTQKGIDAVNKVLTPLKEVFQSLKGVLQEVGSSLADTFSNPKKAMNDLYKFVKNNLINRFTAFAVILDGITSLDFKKVANGVLQAGTGVENVIDKTQNAGKKTKEFFEEALKRGAEIEKLQQELTKGEADYIVNLALAKKEFKEQNKIAEDQTKGIKVREEAAKKSIEKLKAINKLEDDRLSTEIELLELKQIANDTSDEDILALAKLKAQRIESRERQLEAETTQQNKLNGIRKEVASKELATKKEAAAKAIEYNKKITDAAIKESKDLLNIFIAEQGVKAKTLKQELVIAEEVSTKKKEILKAELKADKISRLEYNLAIIELDNDLVSKRAEIAVDQATRELQAFKDNHQSKLDANTFFNEELLKQEELRLDAIAQKELKYHQKRLEQGVINQTEYNDAIKEVDETHRIAKEEAQTLRKEAQAEADVINLENQRILDEEKFNTDFEIQTERLRIAYEAEKEAAKKNGADTTLITKKYTNAKSKIEDAARETKLNSDGAAFGQVAEFLGKETSLGKSAGLAQAGINIELGVTKALASKGFAGIIEGALIAAKGAVSVKKIMTTPTKFEKGGSFMIGGKPHSLGGTKFRGDDGTEFEAQKNERMFILNTEASAALGPLLSDINQQYGGVALSNQSTYLQSGGEVLRSASTQNIKVDTGKGINYGLLSGMIGEKMNEAVRQLPHPIVAVEDINTGQGNYAEVVDGANLRA
ncbi:coiled-coil domain-containing protein [Tenacibaculum piscium]|uniref:hypothetical protein n=1 Tax=Tenacibaculum piscium TaxID=1458515 RepID=UPI00187B2160|nr:hypothetical protein [Tenacibaculum piscium]MBE7691148.1 hypothetical protein [Tenacibaculum piscium]